MNHQPASPPQPFSGVLLTPQIICKILSISRRTLRYWVQKNFLPEPLRLGPDGRTLRWHPADFLDFLKRTRGHVGAQAALKDVAADSGEQKPPS
jgi:hypothetical protein